MINICLFLLFFSETQFNTKSCCSYKADGMGTNKDCVIIPNLETSKGKTLVFDSFCGQLGLGSKTSALATAGKLKTLCSTRQPFSVLFTSDAFDLEMEEAKLVPSASKGYKLNYFQSSTNC